jgi:hypothetical protein
MKNALIQQPVSAIQPAEVKQTLGRILSSRYFVNAHQKKKFLHLICDFYLQGRAHELNEHILGYDVFGRDSTYNPSDDPIVRVLAYEIRKKLEAYYAHEGAQDPIRLDVPIGSYQPVFTRHKEPDSEAEKSLQEVSAPAASQVAAGRRNFLSGFWLMSLTAFCLMIVVIVLALSNRHLQQEIAHTEEVQEPSQYGLVWQAFLQGSEPPLVILSNPPILRFTNPSDPEALTKNSIPLAPETVEALRDKFVTNPEVSMKESVASANENLETPKDRTVIERNKSSRLTLSTNVYTGMGEAKGLHYLTDFFRKANRSILLKQSRTLSAEDLKKHNVIMLGGVWVNEWSGKLTRSEDFVFTTKGTIENRNLQPGEEPEYVPQFDRRTGNLMVDYALITVKPNISGNNEVMLLAGVYSQGTEAGVEFVTNKSYLEQLNQRLRQFKSSPRYFQALLKVGVENGIPTTISILALHELSVKEP